MIDATMRGIARAASARYKRKCWWVEREELEQQALLAVLEAQQTHDPQTGIPFGGYAWKAAVNQLHASVLRASSPVSAPSRKLPDLKGIYREMLDEGLIDPALSPEEVLLKLERKQRLKVVLNEVFDATPDQHLAREVLLHERTPREVADEQRVSVERVYEAVRRMRNRLGKSYALWTLWQEAQR